MINFKFKEDEKKIDLILKLKKESFKRGKRLVYLFTVNGNCISVAVPIKKISMEAFKLIFDTIVDDFDKCYVSKMQNGNWYWKKILGNNNIEERTIYCFNYKNKYKIEATVVDKKEIPKI